MNFPRRSLLGALAALPLMARAGGAAAGAALPPELADLVPAGAALEQEQDPANSADKTYRVAGTLPSGADHVVVLKGTRLYEMRMPVKEDPSRSAIVALFKHYDDKVRQLGGKRLNNGFRTDSWLDLNAKLHVFSRPTDKGEVQFALWIQDGGKLHFLMLFPPADARSATQSELAGRLANFGSAPLYIEFDTNKSVLKADGLAAVAEVVKLMKADPSLQLSIEGHTDNVGQPAANQALSLARAQSVMGAVVAGGIDAKRLGASGFGATRPVAPNDTEAGRARNRRVELVKRR